MDYNFHRDGERIYSKIVITICSAKQEKLSTLHFVSNMNR